MFAGFHETLSLTQVDLYFILFYFFSFLYCMCIERVSFWYIDFFFLAIDA